MEKTVIQEKKFGRFPTLAEEINGWVEENSDGNKVVGGRYTIVPNRDNRNQHHRGATLLYIPKEDEGDDGDDGVKG